MTHLAENHEANCQTEKQGGRNGENGVPTVYAAPLSLSARATQQAFIFELSKRESCYCFKGDDIFKNIFEQLRRNYEPGLGTKS